MPEITQKSSSRPNKWIPLSLDSSLSYFPKPLYPSSELLLIYARWAENTTQLDNFCFLPATKRLLIHRTVFYLRLRGPGTNKHNGLEINVYWTLKVFKVNYILYVDFAIVSKNSAVTTPSFYNDWNKRSFQSAELHIALFSSQIPLLSKMYIGGKSRKEINIQKAE